MTVQNAAVVLLTSLSVHSFLNVNSLASQLEVEDPQKYLQIEPRIQGGDTVNISTVPYFAWLKVQYLAADGKRKSLGCGGSIVKQDLIVTAAHCLIKAKLPSDVSVYSGYQEKKPKGYIQKLLARKLFSHPKYNQSTIIGPNDIAVVRLVRKLKLSDRVALAELSDRHYSVGTRMKLAGYGSLGFHMVRPDKLQAVALKIASDKVCLKHDKSYDSSIMICGGNDTYGGRLGDSGGGLVLSDSNKHILVGVASNVAVYNKTNTSGPTYFMKVAAYREFLDNITNSNC